jgi:calcium/calmodulin-dependent protein kinase I
VKISGVGVLELGEVLGSGAYSTVHRASNTKTGASCAVKVYDAAALAAEDRDALACEVAVLRELGRHPNVVRLLGHAARGGRVCVAMELLSGGNLMQRLRAAPRRVLAERDAARVVGELVGAIAAMHAKGIVHRDVSLGNVLFADGTPGAPAKLADFGFAARVDGDACTLRSICGTAAYIAPEILREEPYGKPVDMWSVGVVAYTLLCGYPPFWADDDNAIFRLIQLGQYEFPSPSLVQLSAAARDFIGQLLRLSPSERPTATEALKHPWLSPSTP